MLQSIGVWLGNLFARPRRVIRVGAGTVIADGDDTPFYVSESSNRLRIKPGVEVVTERDQNGGKVVLMRLADGTVQGIQCRCPKGYTGGCLASAEDSSIGGFAECTGDCLHSQINKNVPCGWRIVEIDLPSTLVDAVFAAR